MRKLIVRVHSRAQTGERGATMVEYGLMLVAIMLVGYGASKGVGPLS